MTKSIKVLEACTTSVLGIGDEIITQSEALQAQRTTAIEFSEWIEDNSFMRIKAFGDWQRLPNLDDVLDAKPISEREIETFTTEQLFDIFNNQP